METTIMENQMEKKMENEMETREYIGVLLGLYWDNGEENGNYYSMLGLHCGYVGVILYGVYIGVMQGPYFSQTIRGTTLLLSQLF